MNFLNRAIVPGRVFTKGMYKKLCTTNKQRRPLKQYHHINLSKDFVQDCRVWLKFLFNPESIQLCRPFIDLTNPAQGTVLKFYSDASRNPELGMGAVFDNRWIMQEWPAKFIKKENPSIEYLELYALAAALLRWRRDFKLSNQRVVIYCDNESIMYMVNKLGSSCSQYMKLIRIIALESIIWNHKVIV